MQSNVSQNNKSLKFHFIFRFPFYHYAQTTCAPQSAPSAFYCRTLSLQPGQKWPFSVILIGDFFQLEPIGIPLYSSKRCAPGTPADNGLWMFKQFQTVELKVQHRAATDINHTNKLNMMRSMFINPSGTKEKFDVLKGLKILRNSDAAEFQEAFSWYPRISKKLKSIIYVLPISQKNITCLS